MDKNKAAQYKELLLAKRRELAGEVDHLRQEGLSPVSDGPMDSGDDAANTYSKLVSLGISETERDLIRQIDDALERLEDGSFGKCRDCSTRISEARLKALPYADLCLDCKAESEKGGR